jgi:adenine-specific DNA-methyltransferase
MAKRAAKSAKRRPATDADVESYKHDAAKRKNIPTAENQKLVADEDQAIRKLRWPRNPDLDPQLVWRGKDFESDPLEVDAPPIYIQEKILPGAIIKDLQRQTKERRKDDALQFDFYRDFNGLPEGWKEDATQSYYHDEGNWQNRMILGDSLLVMASLSKREGLHGKVQCIYFDPPYGISFRSNWQPSTKNRDVQDNQSQSISREPEVIRAFRDTWSDRIHSYLQYMRERLTASHDLLHQSGSIFVQIGDENVHLVRSLLQEIFHEKNFIAQISLQKTSGQTSRYVPGVVDYLLWFAKDADALKYRPLYELKPPIRSVEERYVCVETPDGQVIDLSVKHKRGDIPLPEGRVLRLQDTTSQTGSERSRTPVNFQGEVYRPSGRRGWSFPPELDNRLARSGRLFAVGTGLRWKNYHDESSYSGIANNWTDISPSGFGEERIYVVQTITDVVARCILMATDPGDLVLDPTCGSGTTAYVAEQWGRRWITIDTSRVALTLARARLMGAKYDYYLLKDSKDGAAKEGEITGKPPADGPFANNIRHGFVYERAPHVTLKSIANNAEIDVIFERWQKTLEPLRETLNGALGRKPSPVMPGLGPGIHDLKASAKKGVDGRDKPGHDGAELPWEEWQIPRDADDNWPEPAKKLHAQWWEARRARQKEIDDSIARNAEVEYLYDRPYKARGVVRVAGPFTVESLSPHRVLPMGEDPYLEELLAAGDLPSHSGGSAGEAGEGGRSLHHASHGPPPPLRGGGTVITDFAQVVYENLKTAGVQNTKKGERLMLENLRPFASRSGLIAFQGEYKEKGASRRAAVCIGPEYDTVGYELVRRAAREAADLFDMLIVCGFAFAPEVDDTRLNFGRLTVLKARMNQDLRMADKLKATGAGNLFVVFGEPDIEIKSLPDDMLQVEIRGMDIFDPTTGEVRSSTGSNLMNDVAAWFVDHDYDEESFFVRQAYFVGDDPYDGLKRALRAEIDEIAWAELNSTISRPFPKPKRGRICVKVINHFGDEVQKVFTV